MNNKKMKREAKKAAYAERKEKEGRSVINWIIGALIALAVVYAAFTIIVMG